MTDRSPTDGLPEGDEIRLTLPSEPEYGRLARIAAAALALRAGFDYPEIEDLREGEVALSDLWYRMHEQRISAAEGIPVDDNLRERVRSEFPPPAAIDFRMAT